MRFSFIAVCCVIIFNSTAFPQNVYEPLTNSVYNFLENQSVKGLISIQEEVKPFPRMLIAENLLNLETKKDQLSALELQELEFYKKDFADEINSILKKNPSRSTLEYFTFGENDRFRAFRYRDSIFSIYADPVLGFSAEKNYGSNITHTWNGVSLYGYVSDFIGFSLNFKDNQENGPVSLSTYTFTPETGINKTQIASDSRQYDDVEAMVSASWKWGSFSFGKDFINWGSSVSPTSQVILSGKAPSFPFIQLELHPTSWLRFNYIHGWLHSGIIDSNTIHSSPGTGRTNYIQIEKYIAAHFLSLDLTRNFTLSVGESMIYSERLQPIYLIPVMFFRLADHYLGKDSSNTGSNAQMFADASLKIPSIRSKFYTTLFIDELSLTSVLENKNGPSSIGFTLGGEMIDPVIENSSLILEYSRLSPFVYMNSNLAQTYSSYDYQLGSWIGNNGDIFYAKYNQRIIRGLSASLWADYVRKGSQPAPMQQYELPYPSTLFGLQKIQKEIGLQIDYEPLHNLQLTLFFNFASNSDEDLSRTPSLLLGQGKEIGFSLSYGYSRLLR